jgi:CO/xanthine dehydrogenase FAD-binding subunit
MLTAVQTVIKPLNLRQAIELLTAEPGCRPIAGGTDLIPRLRQSGGSATLLDLSALRAELDYIRLEEDALCLGAMATHDRVCSSQLVGERLPVLAQACRQVGSPQIRNRGTIGGNIANASPAADSLPALLALEAKLVLSGREGSRLVPLDDFLLGPGHTQLAAGELISQIRIPTGLLDSRGSFIKLGLRNALTISVASVAVTVDGGGKCRVAYGALAPRAVRGRALEEALAGGETLNSTTWAWSSGPDSSRGKRLVPPEEF